MFRWNILLFSLTVTVTYSSLFLLPTNQILRGYLVPLLDLLFHSKYWKREYWSSTVNSPESVWYPEILNVIFAYRLNSLCRLPETEFYMFVKSTTYIDVYLRLTPWDFIATVWNGSVKLWFWCRINNRQRILKINLLKTKRRLLYLKPSSYRAVNIFHVGYKNQSVYAVSGTSRCLFSDKHKTHKYSVGRAYSCWMLNCWCITWPVGFKRLNTKVFYVFLIICEK